ncbi:MAG TPA: nitroreductase family protein [candidate division Zixibacteria bacterium]|nr:nitroreductase family protein [candidate division Zixibacteria bacterium]
MELDKTISERRSIRRFKPDSVKKELIEAILDAGNKAPSAKNKQHWRFHVFQGEAKNKFTEYCLKEFDKIANSDDVHPSARYSFQIMADAPVTILVYTSNIMPHTARPDIQSVSAAIQNMLLKAYDLGLGSLWICDILYIDKAINQYIKTDIGLLAAVTIGYTDESPKSRAKLTVDDVTTWYE